MSDFENKTILITGGTGSFGNAVLNRLLDTKVNEIRILSRDEKKQDDLRKKMSNSKLKFYIGDVRMWLEPTFCYRWCRSHISCCCTETGPFLRVFPSEAVKTNIIGTENLIDCAIQNNVGKIVCLSTDKAVYPINAMGIS